VTEVEGSRRGSAATSFADSQLALELWRLISNPDYSLRQHEYVLLGHLPAVELPRMRTFSRPHLQTFAPVAGASGTSVRRSGAAWSPIPKILL